MKRYTVCSECVLGIDVIAEVETLKEAQVIIAREKVTSKLAYQYSIVDNTTNKEIIF